MTRDHIEEIALIEISRIQRAAMTNIYTENGYKNRADYLRCLAEDNDVDLVTVVALADILGPEEDFDGLVVMVQDAAE